MARRQSTPAKKTTRRNKTPRSPIHGRALGTHVQRISKQHDETRLELPDSCSRQDRRPVNPEESGYYVYGIIAANGQLSFGKSSMEGEVADVFAVHHQDLAAVVSQVKPSMLDATSQNVLAHEQIVERVMDTHTVIPMSFGAVFRTKDDVQAMLKGAYASFREVLDKIEGTIEFGLNIAWDRNRVVEHLKHKNAEIRQFVLELKKKRLESTYLATMQLARMIERALAEYSVAIVKETYDRLRSVCLASRENKPAGDNVIMNAAFLLERKKANEFDRILRRISKKFQNLLHFKYSGPWPPYNFVSIRLRLERARRAA